MPPAGDARWRAPGGRRAPRGRPRRPRFRPRRVGGSARSARGDPGAGGRRGGGRQRREKEEEKKAPRPPSEPSPPRGWTGSRESGGGGKRRTAGKARPRFPAAGTGGGNRRGEPAGGTGDRPGTVGGGEGGGGGRGWGGVPGYIFRDVHGTSTGRPVGLHWTPARPGGPAVRGGFSGRSSSGPPPDREERARGSGGREAREGGPLGRAGRSASRRGAAVAPPGDAEERPGPRRGRLGRPPAASGSQSRVELPPPPPWQLRGRLDPVSCPPREPLRPALQSLASPGRAGLESRGLPERLEPPPPSPSGHSLGERPVVPPP